MTEILVQRANPMVDPALHVWGWEIAVYLFLGGFVAGAMILVGLALRSGRHRRGVCTCTLLPGLGLVLLSLGMLALFLDLEHKAHVFRLYLTLQPASPMSWGAWILLLVYPVLGATALVRPPEMAASLWPAVDRVSHWLRTRPPLVRRLGAVSIASGTALGIYTGILLSALGARPLWASGLLGPLFLASGLSAAAAFGHLVAIDAEERVDLARADNRFLAVELGLIVLMLVGLSTASAAHQEAAARLLGGPFTAVFWVGVVGLGIVLPLTIQSLSTSHRIAHTPLAPLLVLAGGLALRFVIVYAGQASHWPRI